MDLSYTFLLAAFIVTVSFHFGSASGTVTGTDDLAGLTLTCGNQVVFKMTKDFAESNLHLRGSETLRIGLDPLCHADLTQTPDTNSACNGVKSVDGSWTFTFDVGSCNPTSKIVNKTLHYTYTVSKENLDGNSSPISRHSCQQISFVCKFEMEYTITSSNYVLVEGSANESNDPATKQIALGIAMTNSSYDVLSTATAYKVGDPIYLKVAFDPAGPAEMVLQASTCVAESPDKTETYKIISANGCPESADVVIDERSGTAVEFNLKSFYWANAAHLTMTIKCEVKICRKVGAENCAMTPDTCPPSMRYRRGIKNKKNKNKKNKNKKNKKKFETTVLEIGPIVIEPRDPCLNYNGGCEGSCNLVQNEISCSCEPGQIPSETDRRKCNKINPFSTDQDKLAIKEEKERPLAAQKSADEQREKEKVAKGIDQDKLAIKEEKERPLAAQKSADEQREKEKVENLIDSLDNEVANEDKNIIAIGRDELMKILSNSDKKDFILMGVAIAILLVALVATTMYCRSSKK